MRAFQGLALCVDMAKVSRQGHFPDWSNISLAVQLVGLIGLPPSIYVARPIQIRVRCNAPGSL